MSIENDIFAALKSLVSNRVYRLVAPDDVVDLPRITFQQVGGQPVNFLGTEDPGKKNGRFQVNCWAASADAATVLARQVEDTLRAATALQTVIEGAPIAVYEPDTQLYGTHQDFSFWFTD